MSADLQRIADELEIRSLVARYADGVIRRCVETWGSTWAADGAWDLGGDVGKIAGRDTLKATWSAVMQGYPFVAHYAFPGQIWFEGDVAYHRNTVMENIIDGEGNKMLIHGSYNDKIVKEDGKWVFALRKFDVQYRGPADLSGEVIAYPDTLNGMPPAL